MFRCNARYLLYSIRYKEWFSGDIHKYLAILASMFKRLAVFYPFLWRETFFIEKLVYTLSIKLKCRL